MGNGGFVLENESCLREGNSGVIRFMKMGETNGRRVCPEYIRSAPTPSLCDRGEGTSETGSKGRSYGEGGGGD